MIGYEIICSYKKKNDKSMTGEILRGNYESDLV